jgi:hypothetical protein
MSGSGLAGEFATTQIDFRAEKVEEDFADRRDIYTCELATTHIDFGKKEFEENIATQLKSDVLWNSTTYRDMSEETWSY